MIAWAQMGDANASIPTPQPVLPRPMFGAYGKVAGARRRVHFVAPAAIEAGLADRLGGRPRGWSRSADTTRLGKADMPENDALPRHPRSTRTRSPFASTARCRSPSRPRELPMAQRYFLF